MNKKTIRGTFTSNSLTIWWGDANYKHSTWNKLKVPWGEFTLQISHFWLFFKC